MGFSGSEHGPRIIGQDDRGVVFQNPTVPGSESSHYKGMENAARTVPWACSAEICGVMPSSKNLFHPMPHWVWRDSRVVMM